MEATSMGRIASGSGSRDFHFWMAGVFLLIAFGGFTPTYWARVASGTFHAPPIVHIHGALLFSWTLFYFMQTAYIANGRTALHQAWGLFGISLFSLLVCSILATKIVMMKADDAAGFGDAGRRFAAIPLFVLPTMIAFFALAIANVRRPEIHKRMMFVLLASMMTPALARIFLVIVFAGKTGSTTGAPPPNFVVIPPTLVACALIGVGMIHDWRTRGRPHKVYVYGLVALLLTMLLGIPVAYTATWMSFARWLQGLGG